MNNFVTWTRSTHAGLLAGVFLLLPTLILSQEPLATPVETTQKRLWRLVEKPADIPAAVKENVRLLNIQERQVIRASLVQDALSTTNFEARLALFNAVVDVTIWTNTNERSLTDNNLAVSLQQAFQHDARRAIRDRAEGALLRRNNATAADLKWVADVVRSGRWDALPLAIRFHDRSLEEYIRGLLSSSTAWPWPANQTIRIIPSIYVAEAIEVSNLTRLQKMQLHNFLAPESVYPADILIAYLASIGDEQALESLRNSYRLAALPGEDRKPANKDKLYWYTLLCLAGKLPGPFPAP